MEQVFISEFSKFRNKEHFQTLYQDKDALAIDKPAGIIVFPEKKTEPSMTTSTRFSKRKPEIAERVEVALLGEEKTLIDYLLEEFPELKNVGKPPRYGIAHRLDKDTSGILLVAKNNETLEFLQKQFKEGRVIKKYFALVVGNIKNSRGRIETLIGREPKARKKQKAYLPLSPEALKKGKRLAITEYRVLERYSDAPPSPRLRRAKKNYYTLVEVEPKTGRKHQIRTHLAYISHPIAGDKLYSFKNQPSPKGLERQFLHASFIKIGHPEGKELKLESNLPEDLKKVLKNLIIAEF